MKNIILSILILGAILFLITGCMGAGSTNSGSYPNPAANQVVVASANSAQNTASQTGNPETTQPAQTNSPQSYTNIKTATDDFNGIDNALKYV
jgi:hypothetical protein